MSSKNAIRTKNAKRTREFDILTYTKGFTSEYIADGKIVQEYFQFKDIQQIIHFSGTGVEIVGNNGSRRVFYNDTTEDSDILFDALKTQMNLWMDSNLN